MTQTTSIVEAKEFRARTFLGKCISYFLTILLRTSMKCQVTFRSSRQEVFCKKGVLRNEFCEISKNTFSYRTPPVAASKHLFSFDHIYTCITITCYKLF